MRGRLIPISSRQELPLADVNSITADSRGTIYCASVYYARIQHYDSDGAFLDGWFVETSGGTFALRVNEFEEVEAFVERGDRLLTFDRAGRLVRSLQIARNDIGLFDGLVVRIEGGMLTLKYRFLAPRVVKTDVSGNSTVLMSTSFPKWLLLGPFPAFGFFFIGLFLWPITRNSPPFVK